MINRMFTLILCSIFCLSFSYGQEAELEAAVSDNTVLFGNYIELSFSIKNADGKFEAPTFEDFEILGGPNVSSSFRFINGVSSQERTYTYYLKPLREGSIIIPPAFLILENDGIESLPIEINVLPNPDGIITKPERKNKEDEFFNDWNLPNFRSPFDRLPQEEVPNKEKKKSKWKKRKI